MLTQKVLKTITKYNLIKSGDNIVVGVSGGPDSICMLDILNKLRERLPFNIYVAHINHMIRDEAVEEEQYVKEYCKKNNIQCFVKRENVLEIAKQKKIGTEEAGRVVRYEFFSEVASKTNSNKIATAHNLNDKIETVIMNILRGSSVSGLKGIENKRGQNIRPLIECERHEIEEYCRRENLNPKYDKSNEENIYTRNKIRNVAIPYIKEEFNPNIINTINRLSEEAEETDTYLNKIVEKSYNQIVIEEQEKQIVLDLKKFNMLDLVIKKRLVLYTINSLFGNTCNIEKIHIEDIIKLCTNNIGNKFLCPNKNLKVLVKNKKVFLIRNVE